MLSASLNKTFPSFLPLKEDDNINVVFFLKLLFVCFGGFVNVASFSPQARDQVMG